ncbi:DNA polymerase IV [Granulosicoccaceae sp. 1_MG-2023]|nr:DNA polymerase IV [Granulosicoccaceae sp. 1_MG-2023]
MSTSRKIIHIDMDAFYASVEQRDNPSLKGQPVVVGGKPDSRGVVCAASYEARRFGIHSAMPCSRAWRLCPQAVFVPPRFEVYRSVSQQIREIFQRYTDRIEPLSLDEAYLDVTYSEQAGGSATLMAQEIRREIVQRTGLTASAGVSNNKFLAKAASDFNKPDGITVVLPEQAEDFVAQLEIRRFQGVGPVTQKKMQAEGIFTGADLRQRSLAELRQLFGKSADYFYNIARGRDDRPVESDRERKSIGAETTFETDLSDVPQMLSVLNNLAESVVGHLQRRELCATTLTIKVKYSDFQQVTRSYTDARGFDAAADLIACFPWLLSRTEAATRPVRLLGVSVSGLKSLDGMRQLRFEL